MFRLHKGLFTSVNDQHSSKTLSAAPQQASSSLLIIKQRTLKKGGSLRDKSWKVLFKKDDELKD